MIEKIILKFLYKRYLNRTRNIVFYIEPDHLADCMSIGHVRKISFHSGNYYNARFLGGRMTAYGGLYCGKYEMSKDIQELSFEEFCSIVRGTGFNFKKAELQV